MTAETKLITYRQIIACPKHSLLPGHYAADGTCNCTRKDELDAEVARLERRARELQQQAHALTRAAENLLGQAKQLRRTM